MNVDTIFEKSGVDAFVQSLLLDRNAFVLTETDARGRVYLMSDVAGYCEFYYGVNEADEPNLNPVHYRTIRQTVFQPGYTDATGFVTPESGTGTETEVRRYFKFQNPAFATQVRSVTPDGGELETVEFTRGVGEQSRYVVLESTATTLRVCQVAWVRSLVSEPIGFTKHGSTIAWSIRDPVELNEFSDELRAKIGGMAFPQNTALVFENSFAGGLQPHGNEDILNLETISYGLHPTSGAPVLLSTLPPEDPTDVLGPVDGLVSGNFRGAGLSVAPGTQVERSGQSFNDRDETGDSNFFYMWTRFRHHRFCAAKCRGLNMRTQRLITLHKRTGTAGPGSPTTELTREELSCARQTGARQQEFFIIAGNRFVQLEMPGLSLEHQVPSGQFIEWPYGIAWSAAIITPDPIDPSGWSTRPAETAVYGSTC